MGVRYAIITPEIQKENSLPFDFGALVIRGERITDLAVVPGSPADKAGIVENDIILEIDGTKMNADNQLGDVVGRKRAGDTILMKIWHKGETKEIRVTLEDRTKKE
ncbi:MAG: PDZ domain-containing protein [Candidatus Moraniibacteriota bacterium]|nr:MAG: PDZ domain-containing protein [Candidatus Moranbacteria bacterium]